MKKMKFIVPIALLSMFALSGYGQASEKVTINSDLGSGTYMLIYKTTQSGNVKVSILNSKGETVFTESLKTGSFKRPYNFSDLEPGEFKIVVEDKDGKTEKVVLYAINKVESIVDVVKIANAQNKYLLSIENKESDRIQVRIVDSEKNVLHEESYTVNGKFAVVFNLSKVKTSPTFEVAGSSGAWKTFTF